MPRWPSPDPNSWANPRGRKKGKGTTTKARQARRATSPRVLAKREKRAEEAAASAACSADPLQQGETQTAATAVADPLQQGEAQQAATQAAEPLQQGEAQKAATQAAEPLQQGEAQQAATQAAEPLQQGKAKKAPTQAAEPLQQGEKHKATAVAQPLQQGEQQQPTKDEPLQEGENKAQNKEEKWETALGKRARSLQKRKASKEKQWQVKVGPLPEGKVAEPLEEGPKAKGRPASSVAMWGWQLLHTAKPQPRHQQQCASLEKRDPSHHKRGWVSGQREWEERKALARRAGWPATQVPALARREEERAQKAVPGLAQCLPSPGGMERCCARLAHPEVLGPATRRLGNPPHQLLWTRKSWWGGEVGKESARKTAWAKWLGCSVLMDDNKDICQEALEEGLEVLPITTHHQKHVWYWGKPFDSFPEAVDHLLMMDRWASPCNKGNKGLSSHLASPCNKGNSTHPLQQGAEQPLDQPLGTRGSDLIDLYGQRPCNKGRAFARKVLIREPPQKEGPLQ